jgi:heme-degrading monooxygenase HmoA
MFARITKFQVKKDKIEKGIELYNKSVVPSAKAEKGFVRLYLMVNRKTGEAKSITYWESEELALANEKNLYYQNQLIKFLNFLEDPTYVREGYEVVLEA